MTPEQLVLLAAVGESPDDDTPRLAYADLLDEIGGESNAARAAFIRLACRWTRLPRNDPGGAELQAQFEQFEQQHRAEWLAPFGEPFASTIEFSRGFGSVATVPADSLHPGRTFPWHLEPDTDVWLEGPTDAAIRALPALAGVPGLSFSSEDRAEGDGDRLAAAVAELPGLAPLRMLSLQGLHVTDDGARSLAASPHLRRLRDLSLWWNWMTADGWRALAESPVLETVEELDLTAYRGEERTDAGIRRPGDRGAAALAAAPRLARLRVLKLGDTRIRAAGAAALATSPHLRSLEVLVLSSLDWKADSLAGLLAGDPFPSLRKLNLGMNRLGREAMEVLARSPLLARLTELELGHNRIDREAIEALLAAPALSRLRELDLMGNPLGDEGVEALAASGKLTGLRNLTLSHCRLGEKTADALLNAPWLGQLEHLGMVKSQIPEAARRRLKQRLGTVACFRYSN